MKATPLIINWHDQNAPVYSAHFEPNGKGRLATAGGDNHVRIWQVDCSGPERKVVYLSTLSKHNQAVNVVRWAPKGMRFTCLPFRRLVVMLRNLLHRVSNLTLVLVKAK